MLGSYFFFLSARSKYSAGPPEDSYGRGGPIRVYDASYSRPHNVRYIPRVIGTESPPAAAAVRRPPAASLLHVPLAEAVLHPVSPSLRPRTSIRYALGIPSSPTPAAPIPRPLLHITLVESSSWTPTSFHRRTWRPCWLRRLREASRIKSCLRSQTPASYHGPANKLYRPIRHS
ncbi:hypothetical protein DAI22_07g204900 [Oryza sativa Japonica Group]|nr:hypothetical protein DAI22_07g204900 [Oryza sativa Japonica Group]